MYKITKRREVAGSHSLQLPYESKCQSLHGHNWIITVEVSGPELNIDGILIDFTHINRVVDQLDHSNINEVIGPLNPTAEVIARWVADEVNREIQRVWKNEKPYDQNRKLTPQVTKVSVQECEGSTATWKPDTP